MLPGQSVDNLSYPQPGQRGDSSRLVGIGALTTMGAVLAYAAFEWGGVLRSDQYHYLLVLGLLAVAPARVFGCNLRPVQGNNVLVAGRARSRRSAPDQASPCPSNSPTLDEIRQQGGWDGLG